MKRRRTAGLAALLISGSTTMCAIVTAAGCASLTSGDMDVKGIAPNQVRPTGAAGWAGGGGRWSGGGSEWGGGGGMWSGGGGWWSGGGGMWSGGGGQWSGGGGQWSGGGGWWSGGGGWWSGGGGNWSGGGGMWSGGFASALPFVGWSDARHWNFRGVPKDGYDPASPPSFSVAPDTSTCPAGQVRLGGFAYPIDVDSWPAFVALGYNQKLCVPTPGGGGLTMNPTAGDTTLTEAGGYNLTADRSNVTNDVYAMKGMVGWGRGNIATQYGGALCASIGTFAAAKRSCGVGIAFSEVNKNKDGSLSQRGVTMNAAQAGTFSYRTPFGRAKGFSIYGEAPNHMESYANQILKKHATKTVPTTVSGIDAWNNANTGAFSFTGTDFTGISLTTSTDATKLKNDAVRGVTSPLNMIPVDASGVLTSDMAQSLAPNLGDLHLLTLHSLAFHQSPLYGSGGGRWFFKAPDLGTQPLMDVSSIFQGSTYVVTGQLSGLPSTNPSITNSYISDVRLRYADWRPNPSGALYIDHAGQLPSTVGSDADREARLDAALRLERPQSNLGVGYEHTCAITSAGGALKCWGINYYDSRDAYGMLGDGTTALNRTTATDVVGLSSGVAAVSSRGYHTCALTTAGAVKCWGLGNKGQLGTGNTNDSTTPRDVQGLSSGVAAISAGRNHACALLTSGGLKCWGNNLYESNPDGGQLGDGTTTDRATPVNVVGLSSGVASVEAGSYHTCAVTTGGAAKCWGRNDDGQLGDGTSGATAYKVAPVDVQGLASGVVALSGGRDHTCALTKTGGVKCWGSNGEGQLGDGTSTSRLTPVNVSGLSSGVAALAAGAYHTCAILAGSGAVKCWGKNDEMQSGVSSTSDQRTPVTVNVGEPVTAIGAGYGHTCVRLKTGGIKCWGRNINGQLGNGSTTGTHVPTDVSGAVSNSNLIASQGSVLISKFAASSGEVAGHVAPIPWSMTKTSTGAQALMVTYDPLAAAAAIFIEQYPSHIAACNSTTSESMTEAEQKARTKLWACSNATGKTNYLAGMQAFLNGARHYLFGYDDGCIADGASCPVTNVDWVNAHLPYTFVVPDYQTAAFDSGYYAQITMALQTYRNNVIASSATRLEKTLQLAGAMTFTSSQAIVTSRVTRSGAYAAGTSAADCIQNDGFSLQDTPSCTPESNTAFCSRLGAGCGSVTGADNCGTSRTVASCGTCTSPQTCGGGGTANVCGAAGGGTTTVFDAQVSSSADDAEQTLPSGNPSLSGADLELIRDASDQIVGIRFRNVTVPQGKTITTAYIQFTTDATSSTTTNLTVQGQASDNASAFTTSSGNLSSTSTRPRTSAVSWSNVPSWSTAGQAGANQRTPELKSIVQAIVSRPGWASSNSMVFLITGVSGSKRIAYSYDGSSTRAPKLHIEYSN